MQLEEKDVVSSVATVLSDLCGPSEWMPMEKLHAEVSTVFSADICLRLIVERNLYNGFLEVASWVNGSKQVNIRS